VKAGFVIFVWNGTYCLLKNLWNRYLQGFCDTFFLYIKLTDLCADFQLKLVNVMPVTSKYKILKFISVTCLILVLPYS